MEGHPEEDNDCEHETERHDALFGFFLRQFLNRSLILCTSLLLTTFRMTECRAEQIVDGNRKNQRSTSDSKREMVGIVGRIAQRCLGILLNLNSCSRSKQSTDIDSHIENREARVALVLVLRIIIKIANHHLQVAFEKTCTKTDKQQGAQHYYQCQTVTT